MTEQQERELVERLLKYQREAAAEKARWESAPIIANVYAGQESAFGLAIAMVMAAQRPPGAPGVAERETRPPGEPVEATP